MKRLALVICVALCVCLCMAIHVRAEDYQNYQEIIFEDDEAILLKDFSDAIYQKYYDQLSKRAFAGWKIALIHKNSAVEFISETKLKIYNNGYSTIKHDIKLQTKTETKYQISASGSISTTLKGDVKKFKGTLDADIKASVSYTTSTTTSETYEFTIIVDPKTYVTIITRGQGYVSNGVAKSYFFWIETNRGGWETFTITTEYYEIIKDKI